MTGSPPTRGCLRARIRESGGFTVVEVVVAAMLVVAGALATLALLDTAARNTFRGEQSQVVVNRLQDEIEQIKALSYDEVALTALPGGSSNPDDPRNRVSSTMFDLDRDGTASDQLVYNGSALEGGGEVTQGTLATGPEEFTSGDVEGTLQRFVVWRDDPTCPEAKCPGAQDMKRVVVAIRLAGTASGGDRPYQELHADVADPEALPESNPGPGGGGGDETYPWTFWLTDTPCSQDERQEIVDDHATHNTLGRCATGMRTGGSAGAPDLMLPEAAPLDEDLPPDQQPQFDYAEDVEPTEGADQDKGLQLRKPSGLVNSCALSTPLTLPLLESVPHQKIHSWLTPEIPGDATGILLTGEATLHLWTRTLSDAAESGRICIYLFRRQLSVLGTPIDTPLVNLTPPLLGATYFEYEQSPWPAGGYQQIEIPLDFALDVNGGAVPLLPDTRLGVAIMVKRNGTQGDGLQFMYDHPSFDSRLTVYSESALPF